MKVEYAERSSVVALVVKLVPTIKPLNPERTPVVPIAKAPVVVKVPVPDKVPLSVPPPIVGPAPNSKLQVLLIVLPVPGRVTVLKVVPVQLIVPVEPSKVTVPPLAVKVPAVLVKLPATVMVPDGAVKVPEERVNAPSKFTVVYAPRSRVVALV